MKHILLSCLFLVSMVYQAQGAVLSSSDKANCQKLLKLAEEKQVDSVYEYCGFDDETIAWYEWAPFVSASGYKKALYELCQRYPEHDYAELYCQKSADLNYPPAFFALAKKAYARGEMNLYENYLNTVIQLNDIKDKTLLTTESDLASRHAYEALAKVYYDKADISSREKALQYLQIAADAGSVSAAHTLGVALFWNKDAQQQALSEKYLWKAILMGCPAAEENLGLMNYLKQGRLYQQDASAEIGKRLFTCQPSPTSGKKLFLDAKDCDCPQVLSWFESQKDKPFLVTQIFTDSALLKDKNGFEHSVSKGDKVIDGYVVEDVRPTAVIVRKVNERHVLLYRDDIACAELCVNPNVIPKRYVSQLPPYMLEFSELECYQLAKGIEALNNPMMPFKGLPECQLQDWEKWGNSALNEKRNKHLFLLANYEQSNYIPAKLAYAQLLMQQADEAYLEKIETLLEEIAKSETTDTLSAVKKEQAFCLASQMYTTHEFKDEASAFNWAKAGADEGYVYSINQLGVFYAMGFGVPEDKQKAMELFNLANEFSDTPFLEALENYQIVKTQSDLKKIQLPSCEEIGQQRLINIQRLLKSWVE